MRTKDWNSRLIVAGLALLCLSGCATLMGSASYHYESTDPATGRLVKVRIDSRREVAGPASIEIAADGTVKVQTGNLTGGQLTGTEAVLLNALIGRVLGPVATPAPTEPEQ